MPGPEFARRINSILAAADRPSISDGRPSRSAPAPNIAQDTRAADREDMQTIPEQMGTAKR
ncbi:hypothetical protein AB0D40_31760 [Streptomyces massasporeus]|uniref:hypothetical protein n=1 Tax=Streptomyces massasporeus TaxID=67324 RepID=UPI0033E96985